MKSPYNPTSLSQPFVLLVQWPHSYIKHSWLTHRHWIMCVCDRNTKHACLCVCGCFIFSRLLKKKEKGTWPEKRSFLASNENAQPSQPTPCSKTHACAVSESPKGKAKALFWVHWCSLSLTYLYDVIHTPGTEPWLATYIVTWRTLTMSLSSHFQVDIYDAAQVKTQWGDCIAKSYS